MHLQKQKSQKVYVFVEFTLVVLIVLGFFVHSAFSWASGEGGGTREIRYDTSDAVYLIVYELTMLILLTLYLRWRGYDWRDFGISTGLSHITAGLVMFIANYLAYLLLYRWFGAFLMSLNISVGSASFESAGTSYVIDIAIPVLVLFTWINAMFEEFVLVSYSTSALGRHLPGLAVLAISVIMRLSFHFYQGPIILISILPMGIIHFVFYWYKRNLVAITLSHAIMDFLSFYVYMLIS